MITSQLIEIKGKNKSLTSEDLKHINAIGVELEGGWYAQPENIHEDESIRNITRTIDLPVFIGGEDNGEHDCHSCVPHRFANGLENVPGMIYCNDDCMDTSHCNDSCDLHCGCQFKIEPAAIVGECISPPLGIEAMRSWIEQNVPDKVNPTCGLHIHVSMKDDNDYLLLAERKFQDYFVKWLTEWANDLGIPKGHEFWDRLQGRNKYCMPVFQPELQMTLKDKNRENPAVRRTMLNYCFNFIKEDGAPRKTLECRVFPAFNHAGYIVLAVESFVSCIETYLAKEVKTDLKSIKVVTDSYGRFRETEDYLW